MTIGNYGLTNWGWPVKVSDSEGLLQKMSGEGEQKHDKKESSEEIKKRLLAKSYKITAGIIVYFGVTAFLGASVGRIIDERFGIRPLGTVALLLVTYLISWLVAKKVLARIIKN